MLARVAARAGELALRTAFGANRFGIVSQLFIESLLLAMFAAAVGLLSLRAIATGPDYLVAGLPFWVDFEVSQRTAVLPLSLAVVSAVVAGVAAALWFLLSAPRGSPPYSTNLLGSALPRPIPACVPPASAGRRDAQDAERRE